MTLSTMQIKQQDLYVNSLFLQKAMMSKSYFLPTFKWRMSVTCCRKRRNDQKSVFRNSVDNEKFLPKLKILVPRRRFKKKKSPGDSRTQSTQLSSRRWELLRRRWNIFLLSSRCFFHRWGWLILSKDFGQPDDHFQHSSLHLQGHDTLFGSEKANSNCIPNTGPKF